MKSLLTVLVCLLLLCALSKGATPAPPPTTAAAAQPIMPSAAFPWRVQPILPNDYMAAYFDTGWFLTEHSLPIRFPEFPLCFYDYSPHYSRVFGAFYAYEPRFLWAIRNHYFPLGKLPPQDATLDARNDPLCFLCGVFSSFDLLGLRGSSPPKTSDSLFPLSTQVSYWVPPP